MTNLVLAATMRVSAACNLLVGVRKMENLLDTVKADSLVLETDDIARMQKDCDAVVQAAACAVK